MILLKFGVVIKVSGKDYVYLESTKEVVYLAHILDPNMTDVLLNEIVR